MKRTGIIPLCALIAALVAVVAIQGSQRLWEPTAALTFRLVLLALHPLLPALQSNFNTLTLSTDRFAVTISEQAGLDDPASALSALTLLLGGLAVIRGQKFAKVPTA